MSYADSPRVRKEIKDELIRVDSPVNVEVVKLECSKFVIDCLITDNAYTVSDRETWTNSTLKGYFCGYEVHIDRSKERGDYEIIKKVLYEPCPECGNKKMYDEKQNEHYCPLCDSGGGLMSKIYNSIR